ncbi:aldehyde dehydrogenase [Caenispirillum salinarum AK4]|uniref:Aldehyde dehydrogenase n=1 Tax=Caenispirillum salinarum AK4 TaxID=1238182 RepID=K9H268_9PROT|nr:aldehyde dehydrogenase family protein [Caenispirillum salinarum]EKV32380.1 aldehyde dehydrogenase [Caenispirillum salinarum AK4]
MTAEPQTLLKVISPIDGSVYVERPLAADDDIAHALTNARLAADRWQRQAVTDRVAVCAKLLDRLKAGKGRIAQSLAWQVGTPVTQAEAEVAEAEDLVRTMMGLGPSVLSDIHAPEEPGTERLVRRVPRGVVFVTLPWSQPWLTALCLIAPALIAGNAVIIRPAPQAPLPAEIIVKALTEAGLPDGVARALHLSEADAARVAGAVEVDMLLHAGEPEMTRWLVAAAATRQRPVEIIGPAADAAYVRRDAKLEPAAEALARAAFADAGRGFGAPRRLYVHAEVHDRLATLLAGHAAEAVLGDPLDAATTLGPLPRREDATLFRNRLEQAEMQGARDMVEGGFFPADDGSGLYCRPRVLTEAIQSMDIVREPTPGPLVALVRVSSDEEAAALINDGPAPRAASLWTQDLTEAHRMAANLRVGVVTQNLVGGLDGNLVWTGVKGAGDGVMLSRAFYERVTRPMTLNFQHTA